MQEKLLNEMLIDAIMRKMASKTTGELFQIWRKEVVDEYRSEETLEAVRRILETRGEKPPSQAEVLIKDPVIIMRLFFSVTAVVLLSSNALTMERYALLSLLWVMSILFEYKWNKDKAKMKRLDLIFLVIGLLVIMNEIVINEEEIMFVLLLAGLLLFAMPLIFFAIRWAERRNEAANEKHQL